LATLALRAGLVGGQWIKASPMGNSVGRPYVPVAVGGHYAYCQNKELEEGDEGDLHVG
jgi:hypothetical protein